MKQYCCGVFLAWIMFMMVICRNAGLKTITDPTFVFGDEKPEVAIYRLIGNDMPPLQERGQLRWNTKYALLNEPHFPGARKRWILNRIWNETEFELTYRVLLAAGVNRQDIIVRCFDFSVYDSLSNMQEKLLYVTSQNDARNTGILDGRSSGFTWSIILDGNTFITGDSWEKISNALRRAEAKGQHYLKIPYHRIHVPQSESWLNASTTMDTVIQYAPTKGESQMAFHKNATELFSLGDTNPDKKDVGSRRGYGQRNKSYMFKEGGICSLNSSACACSEFEDGNEEDIKKNRIHVANAAAYCEQCGLVLRLWNYPTADVIHTGLTAEEEKGFFCFYKETRQQMLGYVRHRVECSIMHDAVRIWKLKPTSEKKEYRAHSEACRKEFQLIYLNESCFRYNDRQLAQSQTAIDIESTFSTVQRSNSLQVPLCPNLDVPGKKYLLGYDEITLATERVRYQITKEALLSTGSSVVPSSHDPMDVNALRLVEYIDSLIGMARNCLDKGPYSVTTKTRLPSDEKDPRYYFSEKPTHWRVSDLTPELKSMLDNGQLVAEDGYVVVENHPAPGTVIGGPHEEYYDRSKAWYLTSNVTTLALAWFFTDNITYAQHAATLVRSFFLNSTHGMYPTLSYARNGARTGLMDWKDLYMLIDATVMLEWSGTFTEEDERQMRIWCKDLVYWYMMSPQGRESGRALGNHALLFDLSVLSLSTYSRIDPAADNARSRLLYRLFQPAPLGQFSLSGEPYYDLGKPAVLHDATFTVQTWITLASAVEAIRVNAPPRGAIQSLWWVRHVGDSAKEQPVLLKAIRWLLRFLPAEEKAYYIYTSFTNSTSSSASSSSALFNYTSLLFNFTDLPSNSSTSFSDNSTQLSISSPSDSSDLGSLSPDLSQLPSDLSQLPADLSQVLPSSSDSSELLTRKFLRRSRRLAGKSNTKDKAYSRSYKEYKEDKEDEVDQPNSKSKDKANSSSKGDTNSNSDKADTDTNKEDKYMFSYQQVNPYAYDRLLEIVRAACKFYGTARVFSREELQKSQEYARRVNIALMSPLYNVHVATFSNYSSVDPTSGGRLWGELGILEKRTINK